MPSNPTTNQDYNEQMISTQEQRRRVMKQKNIKFHGPIDSTEITQLPEKFNRLFTAIQALGSVDYDTYKETITIGSDKHPWRNDVRKRSHRIAAIARQCDTELQNEAGWRYSLEHEVLYRFSIEVVW